MKTIKGCSLVRSDLRLVPVCIAGTFFIVQIFGQFCGNIEVCPFSYRTHFDKKPSYSRLYSRARHAAFVAPHFLQPPGGVFYFLFHYFVLFILILPVFWYNFWNNFSYHKINVTISNNGQKPETAGHFHRINRRDTAK